MKVVFDPINSHSNKYVDILVNGLAKDNIKVYSLNDLFKSISVFKQVKIIHLNWYENLTGRFSISFYYRFLKKIFILTTLSLCGKKIVWTMHNKMPHDIKMVNLKRQMMRFMIKVSDAIIIHSKVTEEILNRDYNCNVNKIYHVPHPNYIDSYSTKSESLTDANEKTTMPLKLLFVGTVKPYKNIELLIETVKKLKLDEVELIIAGKPSTNNYGNILKELSKGFDNIKLVLNFIADEQLPAYIQDSDILILPYDLRSSLNSGTVILAFSLGRTVICPQIGTIKDLENKGYIFTYEYNSIIEHKERLLTSINFALELHKSKKNILMLYGQNMKELIAIHNSNDKIITQLKHIYHSLIAI